MTHSHSLLSLFPFSSWRPSITLQRHKAQHRAVWRSEDIRCVCTLLLSQQPQICEAEEVLDNPLFHLRLELSQIKSDWRQVHVFSNCWRVVGTGSQHDKSPLRDRGGGVVAKNTVRCCWPLTPLLQWHPVPLLHQAHPKKLRQIHGLSHVWFVLYT